MQREKHPFIKPLTKARNTAYICPPMPCDHKFKSQLDLSAIDYEPTTLIVGTFNPQWPTNNTAEWFYGRTVTNCFWDVLPRLYGEQSLIEAGPAEWQQFCRDKQISLTDLIRSVEDAEAGNTNHVKMLGGFSDEAIEYNFEDFDFVNIVSILKLHPSIKNVYTTRGVTDAFWRHVWNPVAHYCSVNHLHERKLLNPSKEAAYQHEVYNRDHPDHTIERLEDFILMRWQQEWHF
ncbi:MAG: hypothetical protein EOP51_00305 [Sphingobacteriales bacterium]|nr:MAG: hypothetical protein EOP51_00305 [Sphingobacteriales bacterium]